MNGLGSHGNAIAEQDTPATPIPEPPPEPSIPTLEHQVSSHSGPARSDTQTAMTTATLSSPPPPPSPSTAIKQPARTYSTAIGPSSDQPILPIKDAESTGPTLLITLLLTSGARHPFKLDGKYLNKRNVHVAGNDPFNLSVYKLKELILREWREEWDTKPSSPNYIRLISFGKLLDDNAPLRGRPHSNANDFLLPPCFLRSFKLPAPTPTPTPYPTPSFSKAFYISLSQFANMLTSRCVAPGRAPKLTQT